MSSSLVPDDELKSQKSLNLAPMVDFLFLILAIFAVLAVTRTVLYDADIQAVKLETPAGTPSLSHAEPGYTVLLSINNKGQYKWVSEFNEFLLRDVQAITHELYKQQKLGLLPKDCSKVKVLLQIDKNAQWEPIAHAIFAVREAGFAISPVYSPEEN